MNVLAEGTAPYPKVDPDGFREYVREHKERSLTPKLMSAQEAVSRFVADGDYLVYDCNYLQRGPSILIREVIRQARRDLWLCGKFTYVDVGLLVGARCASKVDCGFFYQGGAIDRALDEGRLEIYEYSNVVMTHRLKAGAMGLPFLPVPDFAGSALAAHNPLPTVADPFTGEAVHVERALHPDVALIHARAADEAGNLWIEDPTTDLAIAGAARRIVATVEERLPRVPRATIPSFMVDMVVEEPRGAWPTGCPGLYPADEAHLQRYLALAEEESEKEYLEAVVRAARRQAEAAQASLEAA